MGLGILSKGILKHVKYRSLVEIGWVTICECLILGALPKQLIMAGGGFTGGAQKSIARNRALRKGRDNIFERKAPKVERKPKQKSPEATTQIRQKFRDQLEREQAADRRDSAIGLVFGLLVIIIAFIYNDTILKGLVWIGESF